MANTSYRMPLDIAIVGGGIAGLTLAIGLLNQSNIQVTIYEAAANFGEIGAGVVFSQNAQRAMSLIDQRIRLGFERCATRNKWASKRDVYFDFRYGQDEEGSEEQRSGKVFFEARCPNGQGTAHRAKFLDELIKLMPPDVARFGKRLVSLEDMGTDGIRLSFLDGTAARHAAVIGCDGIKSEMRKYLLGRDNPTAYPQYTGKYCYRGLVPMEKAIEAVGEELAANNQVYVGHHGTVTTYPVERGKLLNSWWSIGFLSLAR